MIDKDALNAMRMNMGVPQIGQPVTKAMVVEMGNEKVALALVRAEVLGDNALNQLAEFVAARDKVFLPWQMINVLRAQNAWHISTNTRVRDFTSDDMMAGLLNEVYEFNDAPTDILEAADVLVMLYHICIRNGWTLTMLSEAAEKKISERFSFADPSQRAGEEELGELFDDGNEH